ncbi:hypothetical protein [Actinomadura macra]|uniref:hypothetical protein n=1 Tax=Actinomadura macra TaxID=46164 RepID=UPI0008370A11|nr:hypothetical protein [Actinomadura macra]
MERPPPEPGGVLVERIEGAFLGVYLTLISMIQGVGLSVLAERASASPSPAPHEWIGYAICLIALIVVWQEYMVGSVQFAWTPTILDAVVPFTVGIIEFMLIASVRKSAGTFLVFYAAFLGAGIVGYLNWLIHAQRGAPMNRTSYPQLKWYIWFGTAVCALGFMSTIGLIGLHAAAPDLAEVYLMIAALLIILPLFLHSLVTWTLPLYTFHRRRTDPDWKFRPWPRRRPT